MPADAGAMVKAATSALRAHFGVTALGDAAKVGWSIKSMHATESRSGLMMTPLRCVAGLTPLSSLHTYIIYIYKQVISAAPALLVQHATVDGLLRERRALLEAAVPGRWEDVSG